MTTPTNPNPTSSIILYQTQDGRTRIQCRFENQTLWLTQALIAELFDTTPQNVTIHLKAIYEEAELDESATCKEYLQVRSEGPRQVTRTLRHYSLPAILAVGFRVRSPRGTQFRQWATARLSEYPRTIIRASLADRQNSTATVRERCGASPQSPAFLNAHRIPQHTHRSPNPPRSASLPSPLRQHR